MVRWDDLKADVKEVFNEFKKHKIGWIGVTLIGFMVMMGALAPVLAPQVNVQWSPSEDRWQANPRSSPPVWLDWITRDDYHHHTVVDWDGEVNQTDYSYSETAQAYYTQDVVFDEAGNQTLQLRREDDAEEDGYDVLEETTVEVVEREGVENITVEGFSVEPLEGDAPLEVQISATLTHTGDAQNRTISLDLPNALQLREDERSVEYELEPGETINVDREGVFYKDGLFTIGLGVEAEIVRVGVGNDVEVDNFQITMDGLEATVSAEVTNVVDEERTVRLRIDREMEDTKERTTEVEEEYPLNPGESKEISYPVELPREGKYYFTLGPIERSRTAEEQQEGSASLSAASAESPDKDSEVMQQRGDVIVHSFTVADEVMLGDIETVTIELENEYREQQDISLHIGGAEEDEADYELAREMEIAPAGLIRGYDHTFTLDMQADRVPREIYFEFEGEADRYRQRYIEISRPTKGRWDFVKWTGDHEAEDDEITIEMNEDKDLMAHFGEEKYRVRSTDAIGNGSIETNPNQLWYERGDEVDVQAVPEQPDSEGDQSNWSWEFSHWTGDHPEGEAYEKEISLDVDHDKELRPAFERVDENREENHTLTVNVEGNGTVEVDGEVVENQYEDKEYTAVRLEAIPEDDWDFDGWQGDSTRREREVTILLDEDKEVTANFDDEITYELDVTERGKGVVEWVDSPPQALYEPGEEVTLKATPDDTIVLEDVNRGDRVGEFHETVTVVRRTNIRENIYDQSTNFLRREYDKTDVSGKNVVHPTEVLFSKDNEKWVEPDADPLKGEYEVTLRLEGINVNMTDAQVTFSGAVYGVMGTDGRRRDIFQGWVWGARYGLIAGGVVALTTILFGTTFGMTSAYYGGWVDEFMQRLNEILMGIPTLPILIIVLRFWNRSIWVFVLIYALLMWRGAAKVIRSRGLQVAKDTYIEAAESLGSGSGRIIATHMIPQILPYAIAQAALLVPVVIMAEAGLHILGLGDPTIVSWGTLLNEANNSGAVYNWRRSWFWILFPGVGMALVGFGFISAGMAIERIINPKMKQR
ncbi:MAG: ABC transporter permease subunit [Candidatus Thermoplasmatota archaeon]